MNRRTITTFCLTVLCMAFIAISCNNKKTGTIATDLIRNPQSAEGFDSNMKMPELTFDEDMHDFGRLSAGESISYSFHFKNTGNADLVISHCDATCGCTVADFPRGRIAPGGEGYITVTFKSAGKSGQQYQEITVINNSQPANKKLKILAQVGR